MYTCSSVRGSWSISFHFFPFFRLRTVVVVGSLYWARSRLQPSIFRSFFPTHLESVPPQLEPSYKPLCLLSDNNRKWFPDKKLDKARSLLYRSQILQVNMRWKALAEIYKKNSFAVFAPFSKLIFCLKIAKTFAFILPMLLHLSKVR